MAMKGLWLFYLSLILFLAGGTAGMIAAHRNHGSHGLMIGVVSFLGLAAVLEIISGVIFYTHGKIVRAKDR